MTRRTRSTRNARKAPSPLVAAASDTVTMARSKRFQPFFEIVETGCDHAQPDLDHECINDDAIDSAENGPDALAHTGEGLRPQNDRVDDDQRQHQRLKPLAVDDGLQTGGQGVRTDFGHSETRITVDL
ncbi:MAG: hypothetical protein AAGA09_06000 [Pseudomonadota bacterium]